MSNKNEYTQQKEKNIETIKSLLNVTNISFEQEYDIYQRLFKEYEKYMSDSAVFYLEKNAEIANILKNKTLITESQLLLASIYSTKGMYLESKRILDLIDKKALSEEHLALYYQTYSLFYSHYGQSTDNDLNYRKSEVYRDSLLLILPSTALTYKIEYGARLVYSEKFDLPETHEYLENVLEKLSDNDPERAMVAFLISEIHRQLNEIDQQEVYLIIAAIVDVKNAIKDNASMQSLALVFKEKDYIDKAYLFMQEAVDNAVFCNVKYRTVEASASYPLINELFRNKEKKQQEELHRYLILISLLSLALVVVVVFLYNQMKKRARIRKELYHSNEELSKLNKNLKKAIESLHEANFIKEEYIAHFFDLFSNNINKIEQYRRMLNKLASNKQLEELYKVLKSDTFIKNEIEELYRNFDTIFLTIYPTFIDDFNALLLPEEQIIPKQGELLNTELRIYALIRLGIKDSVKIAGFLRYSLRTVYNYRTKVRNKAAGKREEFETLVGKIGYTPH